MRACLLAVLVACGSDAPAPPPASPPAPVAPACTRVLATEPLRPDIPNVIQLAWLPGAHLVALIAGGATAPGADPAAQNGLIVVDASGPEPDRLPILHSFRLSALDVAMRDARTAVLVTRTGAATLDLETGCWRESDRLEPLMTGLRGDTAVAAIDAVHGRVFLVTARGFLRVDPPAMTVALDVALPAHDLEAIAYDPTGDRVIARTTGQTVRIFNAETLDQTATLALPAHPAGGPWVRPAHGEAWFAYDLECAHDAKAPPGPVRMRGPPCLDPPSALGGRVVRVALPSGALLSTESYGDFEHLYEPFGRWSADGKRLAVVEPDGAELYEPDGTSRYLRLIVKDHYEWGGGDSFPIPFALDATGEHYAGQHGYDLQVGNTVTGVQTWIETLPWRPR